METTVETESEVEQKTPVIYTPEYEKIHIGKYKGNHKNDDEHKSKCCDCFKKKNVQNYYKKQTLLKDLFEEDEELIKKFIENDNSDDEKAKQKTVAWQAKLERISLSISFLMNILIFFIKLTAAITSLSLSVLASTLDSFLGLCKKKKFLKFFSLQKIYFPV